MSNYFELGPDLSRTRPSTNTLKIWFFIQFASFKNILTGTQENANPTNTLLSWRSIQVGLFFSTVQILVHQIFFLKSKWGAFSLHILKHEGKVVHSTKIFLQSFHYGSTHIHWHNEDGEIGQISEREFIKMLFIPKEAKRFSNV